MILGIGTDVVGVERIQKVLNKFPNSFPRRLLTEKEFKEYEKSSKKEFFLAKRFAAKEACLKALGIGMGEGFSWQQMEISHLKSGQPMISLSGACEAILYQKCGSQFPSLYISIADEKEWAMAFVLIALDEKRIIKNELPS